MVAAKLLLVSLGLAAAGELEHAQAAEQAQASEQPIAVPPRGYAPQPQALYSTAQSQQQATPQQQAYAAFAQQQHQQQQQQQQQGYLQQRGYAQQGYSEQQGYAQQQSYALQQQQQQQQQQAYVQQQSYDQQQYAQQQGYAQQGYAQQQGHAQQQAVPPQSESEAHQRDRLSNRAPALHAAMRQLMADDEDDDPYFVKKERKGNAFLQADVSQMTETDKAYLKESEDALSAALGPRWTAKKLDDDAEKYTNAWLRSISAGKMMGAMALMR